MHVAYLMGCPIRGVILDPFVALRMGIQGQVQLSVVFLYCIGITITFVLFSCQLSTCSSVTSFT